MSFLLRVVLPDKPGSLGAVATALGNAGADILGVDVVERADGHAIDDLAVELPPGRPPDVLITAAESVPGVEVESVRPHSGRLDTARELELIEEITSDPEDGLALLAEGVPRIFRAGWAMVVAREGTRAYRLAAERGGPGDAGGGPAVAAAGARDRDRPRGALGARSVDRAGHRAGRRPARAGAAGAGRRPSRRSGVPAVRAGPPDAPGRDHRDGAGRARPRPVEAA